MPDSDPTSHISSPKTFHGWPTSSNSKVSFRGNDEAGGRNDRLEEAGRTVAGDKPQRDATLSTLGWCWDDDPHPGRLVERVSDIGLWWTEGKSTM